VQRKRLQPGSRGRPGKTAQDEGGRLGGRASPEASSSGVEADESNSAAEQAGRARLERMTMMQTRRDVVVVESRIANDATVCSGAGSATRHAEEAGLTGDADRSAACTNGSRQCLRAMRMQSGAGYALAMVDSLSTADALHHRHRNK
jgi:hypothetical protein